MLNNNDTLRGYIKVVQVDSFFPIFLNGKNDVMNVGVNDIRVMRIFNTFDGPYTDFVNIHYGNELWKFHGRRNDVAIYDDWLQGHKMILIKKNKRIKLDSYWTWFLHGPNADFLLVRFINRHYNTSFTQNSFQTTHDMINYILENEN